MRGFFRSDDVSYALFALPDRPVAPRRSTYQINLSVTYGDANGPDASHVGAALMRLEVEQLDSANNDKWHGEFTSQCTC